MSRKTERLLAELELLQANGSLSSADFTRLLGVAPRTLRRDIVSLEAMGIPLTAERGRHGSYSLVAGYRVPPLVFTPDEAQAVALGLVAVRGLGLAGTAAVSALAKLERVLPTTLRQEARALAETVRLDVPAASTAPDNATLRVLSSAAAQQRTVSFTSTSQGQRIDRRFDTWALAWRGTHWYAAGFCHLRRAPRSFRVDRLSSVQVLEQSFARPEAFDALAFLSQQLATLPRRWAVSVRLSATLPQAQAALFASLGVLTPVGAQVRLDAQVDDLDWLARELARLPFAFRVLKPAKLNTAIRRLAARLLEHHE